jgi:sugar phosphate isomerase/epimerase
MRFAAFTVSLPEWTPEEAVARLAELGYDGIEWRVLDQIDAATPNFWFGNRCTLPLATFEADAPRVRRMCEAAGLAIPNVGAYATCDDLAGVETAMRGAALLGAPSLRVRLPEYDGSVAYSPLRDAARRAFDDVEALAQQHQVRALVEMHMQTIVPSASAATAFLDGRDPQHVGVIFDPGNMVFEGHENFRMAVETLGPLLAHVHLKNARWTEVGSREDGSTRWAASFAPLTTGVVDVAAVFAALHSVGYDGWISFEDFATEGSLEERTRDNLAYAKRVLASVVR